MKKDFKKRTRKKFVAPKVCVYCKEEKTPAFAEVEMLQRFLTERGKITGRARNGLCSMHQRRMTIAVKHARHLALLPFTPRV